MSKAGVFKHLNRYLLRAFSRDENNRAETGIGVLIIFIALVLVAAVAASVLIHTAGILQQRASSTGQTTTNQVATGLIISQILGYDTANPPEAGGVMDLAIFLTDNTGGSPVNLANVSVTITISGVTVVLVYNSSVFVDIASNGTTNLFALGAWSLLSSSHKDKTSFGVIAYFDPTHSLTNRYPVLSPGDEAAIILNVSNSFGLNISQGMSVQGQVTPEVGNAAIIEFTAPVAFDTQVITLQ
ncbi:MAG TPA: flagellin [Thermoplasmataceae archaeon]|nr:flagellin [Thermoplasmatales archaeon AK]HLH85633.1 flagellin [Thermoplasmataceae archaeon]